MKTIAYILGLFCTLALLSGCKDEGADTLATEPSVITDPETTTFVLSGEGENPYFFRMFWTKTKFFSGDGTPVYSGEVRYEVEADLADNNFSSPRSIHSTDGLYLDIYSETLREVREALVAEGDEEPTTVGLRVKATGQGMTAFSEPILLTIVPFTPAPVITRVEPSTITSPTENVFTLYYQGDDAPKAFTVGWEATKFYLNDSDTPSAVSPVNYTLQVDMAGNNFASPKVLWTGSSLSADVMTNVLNAIMIDEFHATPKQAFDIELRLHITYGQETLAGEAFSVNTPKITIVPFLPYDPLQPVYIMGEFNGWNPTDTDSMYPMFKENSDKDNFVYTYTGYLPQGSVKFLPRQSLGSYWAFCLKEDGSNKLVFTDVAPAIYNATAGFKTITLDVKGMTFSIVDYDASAAPVWNTIGFIGTITGWSSEILLNRVSAENNHLWAVDAQWGVSSEGYHCGKFRANQSYDTMWEGTEGNDWVTPYCKVAYNNGSGRNIFFGPEAGNYRLVFNDLTGHYIVLKK